MQPFDSVTVIENAKPLDRIIDPLRAGVRRIFGAGQLRDTLHGVWLGHPVHPTLVQVTLGAFVSASVLDVLPEQDRASRTLIATGLATVPATAAAGWADWSEMHEQQQRVGLVHAALNIAGVVAYGGSLAARMRGRTARGKALGLVGLGLLGAGGFLGGHLSFRQAAGANHGEDVPHHVPPGWHDLCAVDDLAGDRKPVMRLLETSGGIVPVLVVRTGARIDVLSDRCSHLSGPLHEGEVENDCVTCPWHGSQFELRDGSVRRGPATAPVHVFDVRIKDGLVQVRLPGVS